MQVSGLWMKGFKSPLGHVNPYGGFVEIRAAISAACIDTFFGHSLVFPALV